MYPCLVGGEAAVPGWELVTGAVKWNLLCFVMVSVTSKQRERLLCDCYHTLMG